MVGNKRQKTVVQTPRRETAGSTLENLSRGTPTGSPENESHRRVVRGSPRRPVRVSEELLQLQRESSDSEDDSGDDEDSGVEIEETEEEQVHIDDEKDTTEDESSDDMNQKMPAAPSNWAKEKNDEAEKKDTVAIRRVVRQSIFPKCKVITGAKQLLVGGGIASVLYKDLKIEETTGITKEEWWTEEMQDLVRREINAKRNNVSGLMRTKYFGKTTK